MSDRNRQLAMIATLVLLALANVLYRMSGDGPVRSLWSGITDLSDGYSPRMVKTMNDLDALPELTFSLGKTNEIETDLDGRNPFLFGVDRAREKAQQDRLASLAQAREEALAQHEEQVATPTEEPQARFEGRILGTMFNTEKKTFLLSVELDQEIHILSEGQVLADRYKLLVVNETLVRFLHLSQHKEIEIELEE